ncbi:MAG TPA: lipid-A-disaccharide synthase [Thermoanaerobaculia bacterium]|nr:lipid-A-disaccharide synthase [Thermoanaerobaculia bacterium]
MKLALVAAEASGDLHASEVIHELKKLDPSLTLFGIGGDHLAAEGMEILHHAREMAIVGLFNVIRRLPLFRRAFREMVERIERERPDAVVLVDYPGFNIRLARRARELGIRVIYYISPQIWAWRRGRVKQIERFVDRMIVIFPFEAEFYREHHVPVTYVGNPVIEQLAHIDPDARRPGDVPRIALLPGSRVDEVTALLPPMLSAVERLRRERSVDAWIVRAPTIERALIDRIAAERGVILPVREHEDGRAIAEADVALSSSGTATLECAVAGTPVVVMYRLSRVTYWLALRLVKVPHFSLVNIIAGKEVVPELLQHEVNGERIAGEVRRLLDPAVREAMRGELARVRERLGGPGASRRAAEAIMSELRA